MASILGVLPAVLILGTAWAGDPVLDRMAGQWTGEGERVVYDRKVEIRAEVVSTQQGERLVSKNHVREFSPGAEKPDREYDAVYWIQPTPTGYDLGYGETGPAASTGKWSDEGFRVTQTIQGDPPFTVESLTRFVSADETVYSEITTYDAQETSRTTIRYRRVTAWNSIPR